MEESSTAGEPPLTVDDVLEGIPYGVCILNADGTHARVNRAYLELTGYEEDEIIGEHVAELSAGEDVDKVSAALEKCLESGGESLEFVAVTKQGKELPAAFDVTLLKGSSREPVGFVATMRDVTERKRLEADHLKRNLVAGAAETITGDIIREFDVRVTAEEMGLPSLLQYLAELSVRPPPENLLDLMVDGVRMPLGEEGIEVSRGEIRKILVPVVQDFLRRILSLAEEHCLEIPQEYREFEKGLAGELRLLRE